MEEIIITIKNSINKYQTLKKLNWDTNTSGYRKLNKFIKENNVDISHFETLKERCKRMRPEFPIKKPLSEILVSGSTYSRTSLKQRLYKEGIKVPICEKCGQDEWWHGEKISLILDHINGIHDDNRLENLRILCPNCNASLPTHCGRNSKRTKKERKKRDPIKISEKQRKIKRPSFKQLSTDVSLLGYSATGRKYSVSDNTIRKWLRFYEKYYDQRSTN